MGQVHAKEAQTPASAPEDGGEIPLSVIKAKVVSVSVDGVSRTKNDVILESVSDLFKVEDFEDLVLTSQNVRGKLEDLGCFSKVGIHIDTSNTGNKDYTVTYQVEESKRVTGSVNTMVGNNEGSLMTGVKFPNVLGRGEKLQADYTYGTKKTSNFNISLVKPLRGKLKTNLTGNIYQSNGEFQQSGFKELDRGFLADLAFRSAPNVSHNLQYEAVWRNISSINRAAAFSVRENSGHTLKSALRHILCVDRRDNPIFPKEGTLFKLNQEFAGLGGNIGFFKNELELQANLPITEDFTLQGSFNAGLLKDFQGEKSFNIADHFFLGGPLNVRGFDTRGIGPSSEGNSLGGSLFWASGLHLYAPLPFRPEMRGLGDLFKTHMFVTAGNLGNFRLSGDMGRNLEHVTQDFRLSYGLGLAVKLGGIARIELNYCVPVKERCTNIRLLHPPGKTSCDEGKDGQESSSSAQIPVSKDVEEQGVCLSPDCVTVAADIVRSADFSADPCEDFYQYACGGWINSNPIPDGKSSWNTFKKLWQNNQNTLRKVLERNETSEDRACEACVKARRYYNSCVDLDGKMEKLSGQPLLELLSQFYWNITDFDGAGQMETWKLQTITEKFQHNYNVGGFFIWNVGEDDKNSSRHVIQLDQGGLTLTTRDQYLNKTLEEDKVLSALLSVMVKTSLMLYKEKKNLTSIEDISDLIRDDIGRQMKEIIEFETELAAITIPATQQRDGEDRYNNLTLAVLEENVDFFNWTIYFKEVFAKIDRQITPEEPIIVYSLDYLTSLNDIIKEKLKTDEGKNLLNNYLIWQLLKNFNMALSKEFREVDNILQKALTGADIREERWRECITDVDNVLGFAVGAQFVNETFDQGTKPQAEKMIQLITEAFKRGLVEADWMDDMTRAEAEKKAEKITNMIGFPDYIINNTALEEKYHELNVGDDYFQNNLHFNQYVLRENLKKLDKKVKKNKWGMTPSTINAYYTPLKNQIVFPAGILQAPFFSLNRPQSLNYGAMGVVMGHELSHAFDDQGRQYDGSGNMRNWWRNDTLQAYKERTTCLETEYGNLTTETGEHINGVQTLGENIADNGGLKAAFRAFTSLRPEQRTWSRGHLPGLNLTSNQMFFLSFAQVWCDVSTPQAEHLSAMEDAHSPPRLRVLGTLSNSRQFAEEFSCKPGTRMNPLDPKKHCQVW